MPSDTQVKSFQHVINIPLTMIQNNAYTLPHLQDEPVPINPVEPEPVLPGCVQVTYYVLAESGTTHANLKDAHPEVWMRAPGIETHIEFGCLDMALQTYANNGPRVRPDYKPTFASTKNAENAVTYAHYGSNVFDRAQHQRITNRNETKPRGGFWGSNEKSPNSWRQWASREDFQEYEDDNCVKFQLRPGARVLQLNTMEDLAWLAANYSQPAGNAPAEALFWGMPGSLKHIGLGDIMLDWNAIALDFDGIDYSYTNLGDRLYAWDCDSVVIFNPNVVACVNPEQDISQPVQQIQRPLAATTTELLTIQDVLQPNWLQEQPPQTAKTLPLYTKEPFHHMECYDCAKAQTQLPVVVQHNITLPPEIASFIESRLSFSNKKYDEEYICKMPIPPETVRSSYVTFAATEWTDAITVYIQDAPHKAQEIVEYLKAVDSALSQMEPQDVQALQYQENRAEFIDAMYLPGGLMTDQTGQPEYWQELGAMMKELVQHGCSFEEQFHIATALYNVRDMIDAGECTDIQYQVARALRFIHLDVKGENPEVQAIAEQWREHLQIQEHLDRVELHEEPEWDD